MHQDTEPFGQEITTIEAEKKQIHNSTYIYADGKIIARIDENNNTYYFHQDNIGSITRVTSNISNETISNPFVFAGKEYNIDTELYYFDRRYYDPSIGRFITPDPLLADTNPYAYAENNPLTKTDPTGTQTESCPKTLDGEQNSSVDCDISFLKSI